MSKSLWVMTRLPHSFFLCSDLLCQPRQVLNFSHGKVPQSPLAPLGTLYSFSIKLFTSPAKEQMFLLEEHEM